MGDLEASFAEMLETLQQARDVVHAELELLHAQEFDRRSALRVLDAARSFVDQAQALVLMMTNRGADPASLNHADDLAASFWQTEEIIEAMLGLGRGKLWKVRTGQFWTTLAPPAASPMAASTRSRAVSSASGMHSAATRRSATPI